MKKVYLSLLMCCFTAVVYAQTAASYFLTATTGTYATIAGTPGVTAFTTFVSTSSILSDDGTQTSIPIGFNFVYCGVTYTQGSANANGWFSLANSTLTGSPSYTNSASSLSSIASGVGFLAPLWRDLYGGSSSATGQFYYNTTGAAGSRIFTAEWANWSVCCAITSATMNFQLKLYEGTNRVEFCYGSGSGSLPTNAVIGLANSTTDFLSMNSTTTANTSLNASNTFPTANTVKQWCPPANANTGTNAAICPGATLTFANSTAAGGSWSSSNTSIATVNAATGVVTGVSGGNANISFITPCGAAAITVVTVSPSPAIPSGNVPVINCSTITLTDASGAGTWASSGTSIATVGSASGVVSGIAAGNTNITFTLTATGCTSVAPITVNPLPASTGGTLMCIGGSSSLSNSFTGGTFSSAVPAQATVTSGGLVTGVSPGTPGIVYTVPGGCTTTLTVTVNSLPSAIGGSAVVCTGFTSTLTDLSGGGAWSSSNTALGTINPATGVLGGISAGNPVITYTVLGAGCFITKTATVNAASPITTTGSPSVCIGNPATLGNATPGGGTWSSSTPGVATISSLGGITTVSLGSTTITFTSAATGCYATLVLNVTAAPSTFTVTGGGSYCAGGSGVPIGLSGSNTGVSYSLYNGGTLVPPIITGTGSAISFGSQTVAGYYNVVANFGSPCASTMTGTDTVTINPLPAQFTVTGGGLYCLGGSGIAVGLSSSVIGTNYQLYVNGVATGAPVVGTGGSLNFGLQTTVGTYTVVATRATTLCTNNMAGSVTVNTNPLPTAFAVTGTGGFCLGSAGLAVGLTGSAVGTTYQLFLGSTPVGSFLIGTGGALSFGNQSTAGTYTVVATNTTTGCTNTMSGSAVLSINPLPTVFTVTGGGAYCVGGTGALVGLNGSQAGVNYQLVNGVTPVGSPVAGSGLSLNFGLQVAGTYSVIATNATTTCISNMTGSVAVVTNPLPTVFSVTGGGGYCVGGTGIAVGLSGSTSGINYQLFNGGSLIGGIAGTGSAISFGLQTAAGTYTVVAANPATLCTANMSGSTTVVINPQPAIFAVTTTGTGSYCAGGTGVTIGLSGSSSGVNYQLYTAGITAGSPVSGSGSAISFGLQTIAGAYNVVAVNPSTTCTNNMSGSALITINPLPAPYAVTGGGSYCVGGTGVPVGLAASTPGINYQLYNTAGAAGSAVAGTGAAISFGLQTAASTRDTVIATNTATGCVNAMSGGVSVSINPLPALAAVTGGGGYCSGGTGVNINLGGSVAGTSYQLSNGGTLTGAPLSGTGSPLVFGPVTIGGTYTILATNTVTGCSVNMAGSATVVVNALPSLFTVTGGGNYCAGSAGPHIGLSASVSGINYRLMNGVTPASALIPGNGLPIDFGATTAAGTYTVIGISPVTTCQASMSGSVNVAINPVPAVYTITQSAASYCAGGAGVHVGLSNSSVGFTYQLYNLGVVSGAPVSGTGSPLDFGVITSAGAYTVIATNSITGCTATMAGTASVAVNSLPAPHSVIGGGNFCPGGTGVVVGVNGSDAGISYTLYNGPASTGLTVSGTGFPVSFGLQTAAGVYTVVATNTTTLCTSNMAGSASVSVYPLPVVYNVTGGGNYCLGGTGVAVGLSGSSIGVVYQLFAGTALVGAPLAGTGLPLTFGLQTTPGSYTVVATNAATSCTNVMFGSAAVGTNPLPTAYNVTGGGDVCSGSAGVTIGLDNSDAGTSYQLFLNGSPVGASVAGIIGSFDFGMQSGTGIYTVVGTNNTTRCSNNMTGAVHVGTTALPTVFRVTGGGNYCAGGTGIAVTLSNSDPSATYQLFIDGVASGSSLAGTTTGLNFGLQTVPGNYTVVATNTTNTCTSNMTGSVNVGISPLPVAYTVSGGGNYCTGGAGIHVLLGGSNTGVNYQLFNGGTPAGTIMPGTGGVIDFGAQIASGSYTVVGTSAGGCVNNMTGSAIISIDPLPAAHTVLSSSSSYCAGGDGIEVSLDGSDAGISYQLYSGVAVNAPADGTGGPVSLGNATATGTYTVKATNTTTGCSVNMLPSVSVSISPLPAIYTVTGGGQYCSGGAGVHIGVSNSNANVSYQLYLGGAPSGSSVSGTGTSLDLGLQTTAGTYRVVATNIITGCTSNMSGTAVVIMNMPPDPFTVSGGGNYCSGAAGVSVGLAGSALGVSYQLVLGGSPVSGSSVAGTGSIISFGARTAAGNYTVVGTYGTTGCSATMPGNAIIGINPRPIAYPVIGGGNYCPGGVGVPISTSSSQSGVTYQLFTAGTPSGAGLPGLSGSGVSFGLVRTPGTYTIVGSNDVTGCISNMLGTATVGINALPAVYTVAGGGNYCDGGAGVPVGLSNSAIGINYTLSNSGALVTLPGNGGPLDFGNQSLAGTYIVSGRNAATGCTDTMAGTATVVINPLVIPSVTVATGGSDTLCGGDYTTFTPVVVNGGAAPSFQWSVNGVVTSAGANYSYIPVNGDVVAVTVTSAANCASPATASGSVALTVDAKQLPSVTANADPGNEICQGNSVTFTATGAYGGLAPTYTWVKNGVSMGAGATFTYIPSNGDNVYCILTSNYHCRLANTASSNHFNMIVDLPVLPVVSITAEPGTHIANGQTVTLVATITNGGPTPAIQWLVNGVPAPGATRSSFTSSGFSDGDSITCQVLSSGACAGSLGFNSVTLHVANVGVQPVTIAGSNLVLVPNPNKGTFTIRGSIGGTATEEVAIEVVNMIGQVIYSQKVNTQNGEINEHIQLANTLANGMYLLNLRSGTDNKVFHFVIEQ